MKLINQLQVFSVLGWFRWYLNGPVNARFWLHIFAELINPHFVRFGH
jgi:hypothetical protein